MRSIGSELFLLNVLCLLPAFMQEIDVQKTIEKLELKDKPKSEWAKRVGEKLKEKADAIAPSELRMLAQEILKDDAVRKAVRAFLDGTNHAVKEEAWFYLEVMENDDAFLRGASNRAFKKVVGELEGAFLQGVTMTALGKLGESKVDTRKSAALALWQLAERLEETSWSDVCKALVLRLDDTDATVRSHSGWCLSTLSSRLKGDVAVEITKLCVGKLDHSDSDVRLQLVTLLGKVGIRLEKKSLEDTVSGMEAASKKEKDQMVRKAYNAIVPALKQHLDRLDKKKEKE